MACSTMKISACTHSRLAKDSIFECRGLQRSASEPLLRSPVDPLKKVPTFSGKKLRSNTSTSVLPFTGSNIKIVLDEPEEWQPTGQEESDEEYKERFELGHGGKRVSWVQRVLELRRKWKQKGKEECIEKNCDVSYDEDGDAEAEEFDDASFKKFLKEVEWNQARLFSKLAFMCYMAYSIPDIKVEDLTEYYGLDMVTSSLEKKMGNNKVHGKTERSSTYNLKNGKQAYKQQVRSSVAYQIAASAASYVHSRAKGLLSFTAEMQGNTCYKPETAACMAGSTITTVVAVEEAVKQEAARDLRSTHMSPCEWFVCDEPKAGIRIFVIQGSDSLAAWQANLMFEPIKFEETDALVHRGIYESAKGIYEQFMPEIRNHIRRWGPRSRFQFTGHSLGGSLSLLVCLMLLARGDILRSMLLPVVTFGSPFVFCGGNQLLKKLGLDNRYICSVILHRDIVPRVFACTYPNHVSQILKRLNSTFRSHPCLNNEKLLYSPLGMLFLVQPEERHSPPHPLLPPGSGIYMLDGTPTSISMAALKAFLNSPHPLEMLSDPKAYGSEGTIIRNHDCRNYLWAINCILKQHSKSIVQRPRMKSLLQHLWPLLWKETGCHHQQKQQLNRYGCRESSSHKLVNKEVIRGA